MICPACQHENRWDAERVGRELKVQDDNESDPHHLPPTTVRPSQPCLDLRMESGLLANACTNDELTLDEIERIQLCETTWNESQTLPNFSPSISMATKTR